MACDTSSVRPARGLHEIVEGARQVRHDELPRHVFGAAPGIVDAAHHLGLVAEVREIGPGRVKADPCLLDLVPVQLGRRDDDLVPACDETAGDRDVRVEVAVRTERGEDDAFHRRKRIPLPARLRRRGADRAPVGSVLPATC